MSPCSKRQDAAKKKPEVFAKQKLQTLKMPRMAFLM
jgi:hypothetical protein